MDDKLELHMDVQLRPEPPSREAQPSLPPFFQRPSSGAPAAAARPRSPFDVLAESDPRLSAASNVALPASPAAALASTLASPRHDTRRSTSRGGTRDERRAAALFLGRHDTLYALAHFEAGRASRQPADGRCGEAVERLTQELQWNRYRPPERALQLVSRKARVAKAKVEKAWCLEESCWKARAAWSDSGTFYDTEEVFEKAFSLDWSRALRSHGLAAYILRNDDGDSDSDEEEAEAAVEQVEPLAEREEVSGEGAIMSERERRRIERSLAHGEVVEVGNVLWTHHKSIYRTFDAYAGIGASVSSGCDHMSGNAFKLLVTDCKLYDGKHCKKTHVDQLFLLVNGREASKSSRGQAEQVDVSAIAGALGNAADVGSADDDTRSLSRCEFLQCLVRLAILKYVLSGHMSDVSSAVDHLFHADLLPLLNDAAMRDTNEFRKAMCYTEETDAVLLAHQPSLRALFGAYAGGADGGQDVAHKATASLLSMGEWMRMLRDLEVVDSELTVREAALAFAWSRLRTVDENGQRSKLKLQNLSLEDAMEGLLHLCLMKALPTDEEIAQSDALDAGDFLLKLKETPKEKEAWLKANATRWEDPPRQPIARCLTHLISLVVRTIKLAVGQQDVRKQASLEPLTSEEVRLFMSSRNR